MRLLIILSCIVAFAQSDAQSASDNIDLNAGLFDYLSEGEKYFYGDGVPQDFALARQYLEVAAEEGEGEAFYYLGAMFQSGSGVQVDLLKAAELFQKGIDLGSLEATIGLAGIHLFEDLDGFSPDKAEPYLLSAASLDYPVAQYLLGSIYEGNFGSQLVDWEKSLRWYIEAAKAGIGEAAGKVGIAYWKGLGTEIDFSASKLWLETAINLDYDTAAINLLNLLIENGEYELAKEVIKDANGLSNEIANSWEFSFAAGRLFYNLASYRAAEEYLLLSLSKALESTSGNASEIWQIYNGLGSLYAKMLDHDNANRFFSLAIKSAEASVGENSHYRLSASQNNLAINLRDQGRLEESLNLFESLVEDPAVQKYQDIYPSILSNFGSLKLRLGEIEDAERFTLMAMEFNRRSLGELNDRYARNLSTLSMIRLANGDVDSAMATYEQSNLIMSVAIGDSHPDTIGSMYDFASALYRAGHGDIAATISKSIPDLVSKRLSIELNSSADEDLIIQRAALLDSILALDTDDLANPHAAERSFRAAQLARTTKAEISINKSLSRQRGAQSLVLSRLIQDLELERSRIIESALDAARMGAGSVTEFLSKNLDAIQELEQKIIDEIGVIEYEKRAQKETSILSLAQVQSSLSPNEMLLFVSEKESVTSSILVFLITSSDYSINLIEDSSNIIAADISRLVEGIKLGQVLSSNSSMTPFDLFASYRLFSKLFGEKFDKPEGIDHLFTVVSGDFEKIPFGILVTKPPSDNGPLRMRYNSASWLVEDLSISVLPSVRSLAILRSIADKKKRYKQNFIGFGDPVLSNFAADTRAITPSFKNTPIRINEAIAESLGELPETSQELRAMQLALGGNNSLVFLRENANEANFKSLQYSEVRVLSIATHGLLPGQFPGVDEPSLVLSLNSGSEDGLLTASEIMELEIEAELVVLSACSTAYGDSDQLGLLNGLSEAFFYAGANSLIVSHWDVDSVSTAELFSDLFGEAELSIKQDYSKLLRRASLGIMNRLKSGQYGQHPALWGAFSYVGL